MPIEIPDNGSGDNNKVLSYDSTNPDKVEWVTPSAGDVTGIDAGTGIRIDDGTTATPEVNIADGGVGTTQLAADAVTNAKLADDAVEEANIKNAAVTNAKIKDGTIEADKLEATNTPTDGQIVTYDSSSGGFTWEAKPSGGGGGSGDITGVTAGTGLSGGGQSGGVTLNVNTSKVPYVSSTPSTGQALRKTSTGWEAYTPSSGGGGGSGDITGVTAGTGLSGGGQSGGVTLNVNTSKVPYVSSTPSTGQALRKTSTGWEAYTPSSGGGGGSGDITGVTAGTGLSGGGQSGSVTLNINSNRVPYYSSTISTGQALKKTSSGWTTYTPSSGAGVVSISQSAYNSLSTKQSVLYAITS